MEYRHIKLVGRIFIRFLVTAESGLHMGGSDSGIEIGGVDKTVIRDGLTNRPYIPGSSLRGKLRSLLEKYHGLPQNQRVGQGYIHSCGAEFRSRDDLLKKGKPEYQKCPVCQVFGVPGERDFASPARLIVRDVFLSPESVERLEKMRTELPYTEVKAEVSIDRVTSEASPRQVERVPAGAVFGPAELVYSVYAGGDCEPEKDIERLSTLFEGMQLLEDDYLGGLGSRGSGKVRLGQIQVLVRGGEALAELRKVGEFAGLPDLAAGAAALAAEIRAALGG